MLESLKRDEGIMRSLGKEYARRDKSALGRYFYSSLIFLFIIDIAVALLFLGLDHRMYMMSDIKAAVTYPTITP